MYTDKLISKDNNLFFQNDYIDYLIPCNSSDIFSSVEEKLYEEYSFLKITGIGEKNIMMNNVMNNLDQMFPNIMMISGLEANSMVGNNHISFYSNGIEIDKSKTLKEKNIKDNAIILFKYSNIKQVNFNTIDKSLNLEENNIKNDAIISMEIIEGKKIEATFNSIEQNTKCSISCYDSEFFSDIEKELYKKVHFNDYKYYFNN